MTTVATLVVAMEGNIGGFMRSMDIAESRMIKMAGLSGATGAALAAGIATGTAAVAVSLKAFADWDTAITGVSKTVDATETQFAELSEGILEMSRSLPFAATEIAGVAQTAGQLGIAVGEIEQFTKVMLDLGVATDLTAEQAAFSIAKMVNVMQTPVDQVDRLASSLVDLGNNTAATEAEILAFARRWAGVAETLKITEAQLLGMSASFVELGVPSELGGTAVARVFLEMKKAVDTANEELTRFAEISGMSEAAFSRMFRDDPTAVFLAFAQGLGQVEAEGGDLVGTLEDVNLQNLRTAETLLKAASGAEQMRSNMNLSTKAWEDNTAATVEAEKFYNRFSARVEVAFNNITDIMRRLGENIAPLVLRAMDGVGNWFERNGPTLQAFGQAAIMVLDPLGDLANVLLDLGGSYLPLVLGSILAMMVPIGKLATGFSSAAAAAGLLLKEMKLIALFGPKNGWGAMFAGMGVGGWATAILGLGVAVDIVLKKTSGHGIIDWLFRDPRTADAVAESMRKVNAEIERMGSGGTPARVGRLFQDEIDRITQAWTLANNTIQQDMANRPGFLGKRPMEQELKTAQGEMKALTALMVEQEVPLGRILVMIASLPGELRAAALEGIPDVQNKLGDLQADFMDTGMAAEHAARVTSEGLNGMLTPAEQFERALAKIRDQLANLSVEAHAAMLAAQIDLSASAEEFEAQYAGAVEELRRKNLSGFFTDRLAEQLVKDAEVFAGRAEEVKTSVSKALSEVAQAALNFAKQREMSIAEAFMRGGLPEVNQLRKKNDLLDDEWAKTVDRAAKAGIQLTMIHRQMWEDIQNEANAQVEQGTITGLLASLMVRRAAMGEMQPGDVRFNLPGGRQTDSASVYINQLILDPAYSANPKMLAQGLEEAANKGSFKDLKATS